MFLSIEPTPLRRERALALRTALVLLATSLAAFGFVRTCFAENTSEVLARYHEEDRHHMPAPGGVVFVGSSTIERWGWDGGLARSFPGVNVIGRGVSGTNYRFLLEHVDDLVVRYRPSKVVVYSGDNDTSEHVEPPVIAEHAAAFVDLVHSKLPRVPIVVISIKPSPHLERESLLGHARDTNERIRALGATRPWLSFVDVYDAMLDGEGRPRPELFVEGGLHMNEQGYAIWTRILRPVVLPSPARRHAPR